MATSVALSSSSGSTCGAIARRADAEERERREETFFGKGVFDDVGLDGAASGLEKAICDALIGLMGRKHRLRADAGLNARRAVVVASKRAQFFFFFFFFFGKKNSEIALSLSSSPLESFWILSLRALDHSFFAPCCSPCVPLLSHRRLTRRELVRKRSRREQPTAKRKRRTFLFFRWLAREKKRRQR